MNAPHMSKRHFEYIADIISGLPIKAEIHAQVVSDFADDLSNCNDAFKRQRFIDRCTQKT